MSQNVLSKQTLARLPHIKNGLIKGLTRDQIGTECGVTEKTIDRDVTAWINSGYFEQWIKEEFLRLHPTMVKAYPELVYKELARLIGKMTVHKTNIKTEIDITERKIIVKAWKPVDAATST